MLQDLAASTLPLAMIQGLLEEAAEQGQKEQAQQERSAIAHHALKDHDQRLLNLLTIELHHVELERQWQALAKTTWLS